MTIAIKTTQLQCTFIEADLLIRRAPRQCRFYVWGAAAAFDRDGNDTGRKLSAAVPASRRGMREFLSDLIGPGEQTAGTQITVTTYGPEDEPIESLYVG